MPLYEFICESCGRSFERLRGYDITFEACVCGAAATRSALNRPSFIMAGRSIPEDAPSVQQEWFKEVRKRGWTGERALEEVRHNAVEDREGRKFLNVAAMPKEA